jgi:MarR family transcriptional regulator, lower aerobic nicotinate degradation pathway regulator
MGDAPGIPATEQGRDSPQLSLPRELIASNAFLLGRLGYAVKLRAVEEFEAAGFSPYHYSVLALLDEGARETQGTIADALRLDRSQLVGLLDTLEDHGLVERRRDPNDRRRHVVSLSEEGKRQLRRFRTIGRRIENEFFAPLDQQDRETLHSLLLRLASYRDDRFVPAELDAAADALAPASGP